MKKVDRIETKTITYFVDGDFEWPIKDLLTCLEGLKEWEGMDWEDHFHWFHGQDSLSNYLVIKGVLIKNPKHKCYHLNSEEERYQFYNCVLKVFNEGSC